MKKFLMPIILVSIMFFGFLNLNFSLAMAEDKSRVAYEEKIYSTATITDEYADDCVLVTMDKSISEINKVYDKSFFGDIELNSIEDLTYQNGNIEDRKYFNYNEFRQILKLTLKEKSKENVLNTIEKIEGIEGVLSVEPNYYYELESIPNDTYYYERQWSFRDMYVGAKVEQAWDISTGDNSIKVGIIDTGIANHPDLDANVVEGYDYVNNNTITNDDPTGHGTHVAGIVGAIVNNSMGVAGVCPNVTLVPLQVVKRNKNNTNWIFDTAASVRAVSEATLDIAVLNYSSGTYEDNSEGQGWPNTWRSALKLYRGVFVCSAGNEGSNNDTKPHYPSEFSDETNKEYVDFSSRVISVGATNEAGSRWVSSNKGKKTVTLYAPGEKIYSTALSSGYEYREGTSMAAPHVAGTAALMLAVNPNLTSSQIKDIICANVDEASSLSAFCVTGGRLNAFKALSACINAFELNEDGDTITGLNFSPSETLIIPDEINGKAITGIQSLGDKADETLLITIPSSIISLGDNVFIRNRKTTLNFQGNTPPTGGCFENVRGIICFNELLYKEAWTDYAQKIYSNWEVVGADNCVVENNVLKYYYGLDLNFTIPDIITSIDQKAFYNCDRLSSVTIPNTVTNIGERAFYDCSNLQSVLVDANLTTIKSRTFAECINLSSVALPENLISIESRAFEGCTNLASITLPNTLENIEASAFEYCGLTSLVIPNQVTNIGIKAFANCFNLLNVSVSESVINIAEDSFRNCGALSCIEIDSDNTVYKSDGNCVIRISDNVLLFGGNNVNEIPAYVTTIGNGAFYNCDNLINISIPANVTIISDSAFWDCSNLLSISFSLNSRLTKINYAAFYNCSKISTLNIPSTVLEIGTDAFKNCIGLNSVQFDSNGVLEYIADEAFCNTNVYKIILPKTFRYIGEGAFKGCQSLLYVTIEGTVLDEDCFSYDYVVDNDAFMISAFEGCAVLKAIFVLDDETRAYYMLIFEDLAYKILIVGENTILFSDGYSEFLPIEYCGGFYLIDYNNLNDYINQLNNAAEQGCSFMFYLPSEEYLGYVPQFSDGICYTVFFENSNTIYSSYLTPLPNYQGS